MSRRDELLKIFKELDGNVLTIVTPMVDRLVFIEGQLVELETKPFIRYHPDDPNRQKATPAYRVYKDLLSQEREISRMLLMSLRKDGDSESESPLRQYLKTLESRKI